MVVKLNVEQGNESLYGSFNHQDNLVVLEGKDLAELVKKTKQFMMDWYDVETVFVDLCCLNSKRKKKCL